MKLALDKEQLIERLVSGGYAVDQVSRLTNGKGWQVRLSTGQVVNRFDTGTVNVQGANPAPVCELLGLAVPKQPERRPADQSEAASAKPSPDPMLNATKDEQSDRERPPWC
jgi:predicted nucleotide-binding protein